MAGPCCPRLGTTEFGPRRFGPDTFPLLERAWGLPSPTATLGPAHPSFLPKLQVLQSLFPVCGSSPGPPGSRLGDITGDAMTTLPAQAMDPPQPKAVAVLCKRGPGLGRSPSLLITAGSLLHTHTLPSNSISKGRMC